MFQHLISTAMPLMTAPALQFKACDIFGNHSPPLIATLPFRTTTSTNSHGKTFVAAKTRANTQKESPKIRNRRKQKKFNGTHTRPRLSVFCSTKQLYAMLVDDKNKKSLFYGSTLQKSFRGNPPHSTVKAAECLGNELVKACMDLNINEISSYDRNGFASGERLQAFEIAISCHGFLPR